MRNYYVNKHAQSNGDHEVHEASCQYLPTVQNKEYLGKFDSCKGAVKKAKENYLTAEVVKPVRQVATPDNEY